MSVVSHWIHAAASRQPDRIAIEGPERSLTYSELSQASTERLGAVQGAKRVAIALPPTEEFVIALHTCLLAGAAVVPIDLRLSEAEQEQRLGGADVVVSDPLAPTRAQGPRSLGEDRAVAVMHTSGTTAAPKPVVAHAFGTSWPVRSARRSRSGSIRLSAGSARCR